MKTKYLIISALFSFILLNTSCSQTNKSNPPSVAQALVNQAGALLMSRTSGDQINLNVRKAIELLQTAVKLDDTLAIASQTLISCHLKLGEKIEAIQVCNKWLLKYPKDENTRLQRGMLNYNLKNFELSKADFEVVEQDLSKQDTSINSKLSGKDINRLINIAYVNCVIGNEEKGNLLLQRLKKTFPKDETLQDAYKVLNSTSRDEIIKKFTGS